jgi:hypothetical protein
MRKLVIGLALGSLLTPIALHAHPGGLNAEGCHHDRKRGGYHCHGGRAAQPATFFEASPSRSTSSTPFMGGAFRNCAAARAAGAAPVRIGEPGYGPHLDRDGDGVGCEPYRAR